MEEILLSCFFRCVNLSIRASWLILAVFVLRAAISCVPKRMLCMRWLLTGLRLILPFSFVSTCSLLPATEQFKIEYLELVGQEVNPKNLMEQGLHSKNFMGQELHSKNTLLDSAQYKPQSEYILFFLALLWIIGVLLMLGWMACQYVRLKIAVRTAIKIAPSAESLFSTGPTEQSPIYQSEQITSPFAMGMFCPCIYLPCRMQKEALPYVIAHEQAHIQRYDHLFKIFGFLILALHWLNPLAWLWFILFSNDIEMACDERVTEGFSIVQRQDYSMALLNTCEGVSGFFSLPPGFGGSAIKKRIQAVMRARIPTRRQKILFAGLCILLLLCFMTNPTDTEGKPWFRTADTEVTGIEHYHFPRDFLGYSKLDIFPQTLPQNLLNGEYICRMQDGLFDPTIQMFLACTYSKEAYAKEVKRIQNIQEEYQGEVKRVVFDEKHFSFPAYVTVYANNYCYEYALFPGNGKIIYVFIQFAPKEELLFDQHFLPLDYHGYGENDQENGDSIYVFVQEDGTGIGLY